MANKDESPFLPCIVVVVAVVVVVIVIIAMVVILEVVLMHMIHHLSHSFSNLIKRQNIEILPIYEWVFIGRTGGPKDKTSYRVARTHLKMDGSVRT